MIKTFLNLIQGKPILTVFDVTKRCNSRCNFCNIWKKGDKSQEISLKEIDLVFTQLKKFGISNVYVQGGEPLVRPDIFEILKLLKNKNFKILLITNGISLNEKTLQKLSKLNISITVSLDTLKKENYKQIRGIDCFDLVYKNIINLSKIKELNGGIHTTITNTNYNEVKNLQKFAIDHNLRFSVGSYNYTKEHAAHIDKNLIFEDKKKIIQALKSLYPKMIFFRRMMITDNIKYLQEKNIGLCDAFTNSFRINEKGELAPCLEMASVFDLKTNDINKNWSKIKAKEMKRIKTCSKNTPCFYGCTRGIGSIKSRLKLQR